MDPRGGLSVGALKGVSLVTLTLQNAVLGLSMRHARTRPGPLFLSSTAVVMSELVKLLTCLWLVRRDHRHNWLSEVYNHVIAQPLDTLKVCVPSAVYIVQNNLLYLSASHLDAATYQVTYQLKILTTAMFAVALLGRRLSKHQWGALVALVVGVAMVQAAGSSDHPPQSAHSQSRIVGLGAALGACLLSGFAGIYFEMILKSSDVSVWMRNVQMSLLSLPFGLLTCICSDWGVLSERGFFYGYDLFVVYLVVLQAGGGLLVALVVKYADNILKGFATSLAIVVSCVASIYLFNFHVTFTFVIGASFVIFSIFLYGYTPQVKKSSSSVESPQTV